MKKEEKKIKKGANPLVKEVNSLLDVMKDGHEYESIISFVPKGGEIIPDIRRALKDIEQIRGRPNICYLANVIKPLPNTSIELSDDLPFSEMVSKISDCDEIDIILVTGGGSGQQVSQFVNSLRPRFKNVEFILPYMCMSAGTLWAFSGDRIWMDKRAYIGPIDPQVRSTDGILVPAQSVLVLLNKIKDEGEEALEKGNNPPWHLIRLIDTMDKRQIGDAISLSEYSIKLAASFLESYKFKHWIVHASSSQPVTDEERRIRASEVATKLCSNEYWKSHAHGITREVANSPEVRLKIDALEDVSGLERAVRRLWAVIYYAFDKSMICKMFISGNYALIRSINVVQK